MKKYKIFFIAFLIIIAFVSCTKQEVKRSKMPLNKDWQFKAIDDSTWLSAKVPGVVHLDLLNNGIIPNPYDSTNEQQLQWIGEKDWEYKLVFNTDTLPNFQNKDLVFTGLDTYANVFFNDSLILQADNMYRTWRISLNNLLKNGENTLKIIFKAPEKINKEKARNSNINSLMIELSHEKHHFNLVGIGGLNS